MERLGEEKSWVKVVFREAEFGGCVFKGSGLITVVTVPAPGCEASGVGAVEAGCVP